MPTAAPREDPDDRDLTVRRPERAAAGLPGVVHGLAPGVAQMGVARSARTLLKLNQVGGFDCPGCAWPEPGPAHRGHAEFCENGAKAVAEEATLRRVTPAFFAVHSVAELAGRSDTVYAMFNNNGRSTIPTPGLGELVGGETVAQAPVNAQMLRTLLQDGSLPVTVP